MRRPDEIELFRKLRETRPPGRRVGAPYPNEIAEAMGMHPRRLYGILDKWSTRDWWEYGVSLRCGWFTEKAPLELTP